MQDLNFPAYVFRFKNRENKRLIFDVIRKKFVSLQPEEWVRQHVIHYLLQSKNYPSSLINVEKQLVVNQIKKRYDLVVFSPEGNITLLVECKSPRETVSQEVFDQIARYNLALRARYLMVTNGLEHFYCQMDFKAEHYTFLPELPGYKKPGY